MQRAENFEKGVTKMEPLFQVEQYQLLPVLEEALRRRVCSVCIDRNVDGTCDLEERHECVLFDRLPQIAQSISRVRSDKVDDYVVAIRKNICDSCIHQNADGSCEVRDEVRCTLDRYLIPIIDVIEEVRGVVLQPGKLLPAI